MKKIKVMHIIGRLPVGGAENLLLTIVRNTDRNRFNLIVCCLDKEGQIAEKIRQGGIKLVCLGTTRVRHSYRKIRRLVELLRHEQIDIVHTHLYKADFWGRLVSLLYGVPVICKTEHGDVNSFKNKPFYFKAAEYLCFNKILDRLSDGIIFISEAQKKEFEGKRIKMKNSFLIHNGLDTKRFSSSNKRRSQDRSEKLSKNNIVIGVVARLSDRQKGQSCLLLAMRKIIERYPEAGLLVIGSGEDEGRLRDLSAQLGLDGSVSFLGVRDDIPELLAGMDILVQPSVSEPLGVSILEAMYSGLPVVATNVGGIPEIVRHGETGFLVPPKEPDALADSIIKLIDDPAMAREMGEKGRET
ncbi:MAG TPA: glycosyltransferase, partial [Nitrospirae bacterium]|nr:glycosyltransferase [Nitrospirota bacterium]